MKIRMKRYRKWAKKICKNGAGSVEKNDIWEKYVRRLLVSRVFRRAEGRNSDKESSHVVGIIRNNASARTCRFLLSGGEPP